jgi:pyrroloquinoline quinone (PQQ) biosynthesis protein C
MLRRAMKHLLAVRERVRRGLQATSVVRSALAGSVDPTTYARYLTNAFHYAGHSPKVMAIAAARCMDAHPELAAYLLHHADEERGHDAWALADLRDLGVAESATRASAPVPSCSALIGYVHYVAGVANPVGLFGWMYVLEAVGEDLGTVLGDRLKAAVPGDLRHRFVAGHGVADVGHTHEIAEQIQTHVRDEADRRDVDRVADVVADLYVRMFEEIGRAPAP